MLCYHNKTAIRIIKFFFVFTCLFVLLIEVVTAQKLRNKTFTLNGKLPFSIKGNVYLLDQNDKSIYSSAIISNRFIIKGGLTEPSLFRLKIDTLPTTYQIFIEASTMEIIFQKYNKYKVKGSKLHNQWEKYNNNFIEPIRNALIDNQLQRNLANQKGDSLLFKMLRRQNDSITIEYSNLYSKYTTQKPYTMFNLFLLEKSGTSDAYISNMLKEFRPYLASYPLFKRLEKRIEVNASLLKEVALGKNAFNFSLPDSIGVYHSLKEIQDTSKLILVDFWASWCGPCIKSFPAVKALYEKYGVKGLTVIGISLDTQSKQWQRSLSKYLPVGIQLLAKDKNTVIERYAITSIPQVFLIDNQGKIIGHNLSKEDLEKKVLEYLAKTR